MIRDFLLQNIGKKKLRILLSLNVAQALLSATIVLGMGLCINYLRPRYELSYEVKLIFSLALIAYIVFTLIFDIFFECYKNKLSGELDYDLFSKKLQNYKIIKRSKPPMFFRIFSESIANVSYHAMLFHVGLISSVVQITAIIAFILIYNWLFCGVAIIVILLFSLIYLLYSKLVQNNACLSPSNYSSEFLDIQNGAIINSPYYFNELMIIFNKFKSHSTYLKTAYKAVSSLILNVSVLVVILIVPLLQQKNTTETDWVLNIIFLLHVILSISTPYFLLLNSHKQYKEINKLLKQLEAIQ